MTLYYKVLNLVFRSTSVHLMVFFVLQLSSFEQNAVLIMKDIFLRLWLQTEDVTILICLIPV